MKTLSKVNVRLIGSLSSRRSKRVLDSLLFAINDYVGLRNHLKQHMKENTAIK